MKRGFLFGLGSCFIIAAVSSLTSFLLGSFGRIGLIIAFGCIPLSIVVIRAAVAAPAHRSWLHAFVGWCLGFFIVDAAVFAAIGAAILVPAVIK